MRISIEPIETKETLMDIKILGDRLQDIIDIIRKGGFSLKNLKATITELVKVAEELREEFSGQDKKKIVLDILSQILNELKIGGLVKWFIMIIASPLIDKIVKQLNKTGVFSHS